MSPDTPPPPPPPFSNAPAFNPAAPRPSGPPKTSAAALASLVLGISSLLCLCVTALPALICGIVGLSNIGKSNGQLKGRGLAITGIILSLLLTIVGAGGWMTFGGKKLAENPMFQEIFGAGKAMIEAATRGTEIAAALKAHADANDGKLPASMDELVAGGSVEAAKLASPVDGSSGFWKLVRPGAVLADLPPKTVVASGGPISVQGESLEVVIHADGTVEPRDVAAAPLVDGAHGEEASSETPGTDAPETPDAGTVVPEPAETPAPPER